MEKRPSRFRQSDIRKSQQAGRHTTLPYNNINNNNILSNGAVLHSNNTIPVFNNNKTNVTQNVSSYNLQSFFFLNHFKFDLVNLLNSTNF